MNLTPIQDTDGARIPFFSPDGAWIGFMDDQGRLEKIAATGGGAVALADLSPFQEGASWSPDGTILVGRPDGVVRVPEAGGTPELVTPRWGDTLTRPQLLPGGQEVLVTHRGHGASWNEAEIVAVSLETGARRILITGATDARYLPTGHLAYVRDGTLLAVPFDAATLTVSGGPVPLVEDVMQVPLNTWGGAYFATSPAGPLADVLGTTLDTRGTLVWKDRSGHEEPLAAEPLTDTDETQYPYSLSPDGSRLVFRQGRGGVSDLHVLMLDDSGRAEPLIATPYAELNAEIAPDGRWLAYQSDASGRPEIYVRPFPNVDDGQWQISARGGTRPLWSPDGDELFYLVYDAGTVRLMAVSIRITPTFAAGTPEALFDDPLFVDAISSSGRSYDITPDGRRFLFVKTLSRGDATETAEIQVVLNWDQELKARVPAP